MHSGPEAAAPALGIAAQLEMLIRQYPHIFLLAAVALYFLTQWVLRKYYDVVDRTPINRGTAAPPSDNLTREQRMALARERQQRLADEASQRDSELRREREAEHLEKEKQLKALREGKEFDERGEGRTTGRASTAATPPAKKKEDGDDQGETNPKKLPKLPGGNRDTYEPFPSASSDTSGSTRYRPTGFSRPSKSK